MPGTFSVITVTASPFTYAAPFGAAVTQVAVIGGTVSNISRLEEGISNSLPITQGIFELYPGQQCVVTYSVVPTMVTLGTSTTWDY
jgi:hypothetical protein